MKVRFAIPRCCCGGGGGEPTPTCGICNIQTCGWTTDGQWEVSDTQHPQGLAHGVITAQAMLNNDSILYINWNYQNTSVFNTLRVDKFSAPGGGLTIQFLQNQVVVDQTYAPDPGEGQVTVCLEFANGRQYAMVTSGAAYAVALSANIPEGTSPRISWGQYLNAELTQLNWSQHPDDVEECPKCGITCNDCCDTEAPREWSVQISSAPSDNYFENCEAIDGLFILRADGNLLSGCRWQLLDAATGWYDEDDPGCPRIFTGYDMWLTLERNAGECRLRLDMTASPRATDPASTCEGLGAQYLSQTIEPENFYCSGTHVLAIDRQGDDCLNMPATVTVQSL